MGGCIHLGLLQRETLKNKTFISFRGYSAGGEEVVRDGVLQTTNHTNVWSSRCEVVSNEWSNIPCNCKLNWWWKETQHFYVEWKWVCLIPVTFYFWSHCLASICDVRWNLSGFSRYLWKVNSVSGHWIKVREVSRNFNSVGSWHKRICARRSHMPCSSNKEKFNINSTVCKFN